MTDQFVSLHNHSEFSFLDGASSISDYVSRAVELNQSAVAISDHGNMFGAYELWHHAKAAGLKPIIGIESYLATGGREVRERVKWGTVSEDGRDKSEPGAYTHHTLLATGSDGLRSLYRLHATSYREGYYYKPRIDLADLAQHFSGLVCTTGCLGGYVATRIRLGQLKEAYEHASTLKDIFGEHAYVEIMSHGIEVEDRVVTPALIKLAADLGMPLVATGDCHYARVEDADTHDAFLCLQTGAKLADQNRMRFNGPRFHLPSRADMDALGLPKEAMDNSLRIAESVGSYDDVFAHKVRMPKFEGDAPAELQRLAFSGLAHRLQGLVPPEYRERLEYEIKTVCDMGYPDYFIVLADIVGEGKARGMRFTPSRGSAGGSLLAFAMGITDLDPIPHGLIFERFLNPSRVSLPDIDVDVEDTRRAEFIQIAVEKYGVERVARCGAFSTSAAKRSLQDAARVLSLPRSTADDLATHLPRSEFGRSPSLSEGAWDGLNVEQQSTLDLALKVEGFIRGLTIHPAAIVVAPEPLVDEVPLWYQFGGAAKTDPLKHVPIIGYTSKNNFNVVDKLGLVKFDFLGVRNLATITATLDFLGDRIGSIPLPTSATECTDERTFELLRSGNTLGVFQMDGSSMRGLLRKVQPRTLGDLAAVVALYRPGPMGAGADRKYAERKNGRAPVEYPHPEFAAKLSDVLGRTYGLIVFQEQVLKVLNVVCGWNYSDAALLFDAMRKKQRDKMAASEPEFRVAARLNGYSAEAVTALWDTLVPFADYSFNEAHSIGYALLSYHCAYLKANHPAEFMSALLSGVVGNPVKQHEYVAEAKKMGVRILPPDINQSTAGWTPVDGSIRYGLESIRGVGAKAVASLIRRRPYRGLHDFLVRGGANSGVAGALVSSGALDSLVGGRRCQLANDLPELLERANAIGTAASVGQRSLVRSELSLGSGVREDTQLYREWERATLGTELTFDRVRVRIGRPLLGAAWEWLGRVLRGIPGQRPLVVEYQGYEITTNMTVGDVSAVATIEGVTVE